MLRAAHPRSQSTMRQAHRATPAQSSDESTAAVLTISLLLLLVVMCFAVTRMAAKLSKTLLARALAVEAREMELNQRRPVQEQRARDVARGTAPAAVVVPRKFEIGSRV